MNSKSFLIAGDSHCIALGVPFAVETAGISLSPIDHAGLDIAGLGGGLPRRQDYWDEVVARSPGHTTIIVWGGNQHQIHFLFASSPLIDVIRLDRPEAAPYPGARLVPNSSIRELFAASIEPLRTLLRRMKEAGAHEIVVCGTPPPKDGEPALRQLLANEVYFQEAAQRLGTSIDHVPLTPAPILQRMWAVVQDMLEDVATAEGVHYVPVPQRLMTETGCLAPEYWSHDATHANPAWGTEMLAEILDQVGIERSVVAESVARKPVNPYADLPDRQFWSRSVAKNFDRAQIGTFERPLIRRADNIISAGSCFAANLVPYLEREGFRYLRTETRHPVLATLEPDNFSYDKFSAGYGNVYTARQLLQLLQRCRGKYRPAEDRWIMPDRVIDPFRPGLRYFARNEREFDLLATAHLEAVLAAFRECSIFIFTLGLTEAWVSKIDGAVFPACPGTISGAFDPERHAFVNFSVADVIDDLQQALDEFREINPTARVILTVSPVPLVATATERHVLAATTYSKSVLRVAAETISTSNDKVSYFPAYEIVTGAGSTDSFFEADRRNVSQEAVNAVMGAFLQACESTDTALGSPPAQAEQTPLQSNQAAATLSALVAAIECEEAGQDIPEPA